MTLGKRTRRPFHAYGLVKSTTRRATGRSLQLAGEAYDGRPQAIGIPISDGGEIPSDIKRICISGYVE